MDDRKQLVLRLPPEMHKALKLYAVEKGESMTDIVIAWIEEKLGKGQK